MEQDSQPKTLSARRSTLSQRFAKLLAEYQEYHRAVLDDLRFPQTDYEAFTAMVAELDRMLTELKRISDELNAFRHLMLEQQRRSNHHAPS